MTDERRQSPRLTAYLAGEIETAEGKSSIAITKDVGAGGLLLLSRRTLAVGEQVALRIISGEDRYSVRGKVVRIDRLEPGESDLWRTKVALAMSDSGDAPALSELFGKLAAQ